MKYLLLFSLALTGCLLQPESKPGQSYLIPCADLGIDSVTYVDSTDATSFHSHCGIDSVGEPKPPGAP